MRWRIKKLELVIGQERDVYKFAYIPTKVEKYYVWLEKYVSLQRTVMFVGIYHDYIKFQETRRILK